MNWGKTYDKNQWAARRAPGGPFLSWKEIPLRAKDFPNGRVEKRGKRVDELVRFLYDFCMPV